jgi:hypothetical protein
VLNLLTAQAHHDPLGQVRRQEESNSMSLRGRLASDRLTQALVAKAAKVNDPTAVMPKTTDGG